MGRPRKQPKDLEDQTDDPITKHRIIKAAEGLFLARGYRGVSMKDVADAVQVTPAALYYHFPTGKEDLFLGIIRATFDDWANGVQEAVTEGSIRERLEAIMLYALTRRYENFHQLLQDVNLHIEDEAKRKAIWEYYGYTYVRSIMSIFEKAIEAGEISQQIPAHILATLFQGMSISLLQNPRLNASHQNPVEAQRLAHTVVSVLLDGIGQSVPAIVSSRN